MSSPFISTACLETPALYRPRRPGAVTLTATLTHFTLFAAGSEEGITEVTISNFYAEIQESGVELVWDIVSDENIKGFRIYRKAEDEKTEQLVNKQGLIAPDIRRYIDRNIQWGDTYAYTLVVVREDDSELMSHRVTVRTSALVLTLFQNHPNPFNPSTVGRQILLGNRAEK